jgi:predicted RNA-binding Zn-ribbon protein involved in translation (DUF1610 family)
MKDGDSSKKIETTGSICASCHRKIHPNELYGAHGLCSQCLESEVRGDGIGGE